MSDQPFAAPSCTIEVYPFESSALFIEPGQILSVTVRKSLRGDGIGTFDIQLAPGGPDGTESVIDWTQIITPMSHVLIGMSRGGNRALVMDGIVVGTGEAQEWRSDVDRGSSAVRGQGISGGDMAWFFRAFNFFALTYYGLTAGTPTGNALDYLPGSLQNQLSAGLIGGNSASDSNPVTVGRAWYNVMAGNQGILNKTFVPYIGGNRIPFNDLINRTWENYPDVFIPLTFYFISEESWTQKFEDIFPFPWYEFFITTAPADAYPLEPGKGTFDPGSLFTMRSIPGAAPAGPQLVARVNPTPTFNIENLSSIGSQVPGSLDMSRWNALPLYDLTKRPFNFIRSSVSFSSSSARNFYQLNPTGYSTITTNNNNNVPFVFQFIAAADPASVQRYGFRPQIGTTRWMFDPQGNGPQNPDVNIADTVLSLTGALISWYHPAPLMATADVVIPLSPTILIGTKFRYVPFKSGDPWDFYIEAFEHHFEFSGNSYTRLTLTRGLPVSVYEDSADDGILRAIFTGNAMRFEGKYVTGLPPGTELPLQIISTFDQAAELSQHLASTFVTPQTGAS